MALTATVTPGHQFADTDPLTPANVNLLGNPTVAVTGNLSAISDVASTTPANGQPLVYNTGTSKWGPGTPATSYSGSSVPQLAKDLRIYRDTTYAYKVNVKADFVVGQLISGTAGAAGASYASPATCATMIPSGTIVIDGSSAGAVNKLDIGTLAPGWYGIWMGWNGTTAIGMLSQTYDGIGNLTIPTGYQAGYWAPIGMCWCVTGGTTAAVIQQFQTVDRDCYHDEVEIFTGAVGSTTIAKLAGAALTLFQVAVPPNARRCFGQIGTSNANECRVTVSACMDDGTEPAVNTYIAKHTIVQDKASASHGTYFSSGQFVLPLLQGYGLKNICWKNATGATTEYRMTINGFTV
jgi:hypothetical protein